MDRFVKKSAVKSLKRQNSDKEYDKEYDRKKRKRNFQSSWLAEFPWLTLDKDRGIMKCKICCKWPNVCDPKSPLVTGSDINLILEEIGPSVVFYVNLGSLK